MLPEVGSSRPAIMRSVVVLPQPDGPSRQKNSPSATVKVESFTAMKSPKALCRFSTRISAMALNSMINITVPVSVVANFERRSA
jgi:hypothetical protein